MVARKPAPTRRAAAPATPPDEVRATTRAQWRAWLSRHHASSGTIWLVYPRRDTPLPARTQRLDYAALVEEALCFGWIDSVPRTRTDGWAMIRVSPRKPTSGWSALNKRRVEALLAAGLMMPAGIAAVEDAKRRGTWTALDESEQLTIPPDLAQALRLVPAAQRHFDAFPPSVKKGILQWIGGAKRPETRAKRVAETVEKAARNVRANFARQVKGAGGDRQE